MLVVKNTKGELDFLTISTSQALLKTIYLEPQLARFVGDDNYDEA